MTEDEDKQPAATPAAKTTRPRRRSTRPRSQVKKDAEGATPAATSPDAVTPAAPKPEPASSDAPKPDAAEGASGETARIQPSRRRRTRAPRKPAATTAARSDGATEAEGSEEPTPKPTQRPSTRRPPAKSGPRTTSPKVAEGDESAQADATDESSASDDARPKPLRKRRKPSRKPRESAQLIPSGPRTMLITKGQERTQIAVLEERELIEHYVTHREDQSIVGNVYLGRVQNVLPGMEAAFLDIGEARNAVLYAGEVGFDEELDGPPPRIETMLKSGQTVLAQVTKDPMGSKGARLTTEVSIAGRYLVLVPEADSLGISRRLPDDERKRLRDIAGRIRPSGYGLIVRTAAQSATEEDLTRDINRLTRIWGEVSAKSKRSKAPKLIYSEPDLAIRVVRDLYTTDVEKVVVDDEEVYKELVSYVSEVTPELGDRIEHYSDQLPLFEKFHVVEQIRKAVDRKVWLRSGGHIVIDRTEAMTVIDVNTGRFVGKSNLEETVFAANLEAAKEIAKQLRLRDIGGIIVIDFIDMLYERNREELVRTLKGALARDKTRTQVFAVSELGIVQMTRKNVSEGLIEAFSVKCENCEGRGVVLTDMG